MPDTAPDKIPMQRCRDCGTLEPAARAFCPGCGGENLVPEKVAGTGRLLSWTVVRRPAQAFRGLGVIPIAVVHIDDGLNVTGRWEGDPAPAPGTRVALERMDGGVPVFGAATAGDSG